MILIIFFFNDTATTEIYTLSLHDALPISRHTNEHVGEIALLDTVALRSASVRSLERIVLARISANDFTKIAADRKSTRLNSSHANISYAVFCLKKKKHLVVALTLYISHLT